MTSRRLWRRVLKRQMRDRYLAPHSIPTRDLSAEELLRHASRIYRLESRIEQHEGSEEISLPLREEHVSYFGIEMNYPDPEDLTDEATVQVLPGGRWIIACRTFLSRPQLVCWDRLACGANNVVIPPLATFESLYPCWAKLSNGVSIQSDRDGESVVVAWSYFDSDDHQLSFASSQILVFSLLS